VIEFLGSDVFDNINHVDYLILSFTLYFLVFWIELVSVLLILIILYCKRLEMVWKGMRCSFKCIFFY
jgi:hypothetical protein